MRYRTSGRDWMQGHGLVDLPRKPLAPDQMPHTLATSIFGLVPDTLVEVDVTFIRESTIDGTRLETQVKSGSFSTRSDIFPSSGNTKYIAPNGDDIANDGSPYFPWRTPSGASARGEVGPGSTLIMKTGFDYNFFNSPSYDQDAVTIWSGGGFNSNSGEAGAVHHAETRDAGRRQDSRVEGLEPDVGSTRRYQVGIHIRIAIRAQPPSAIG